MTNEVTLVTPVTVGDSEITAVTLREPKAGEMRGLKLTDVLTMDVSALTKLLPRITSPALGPDEILALSSRDFMQLAEGVVMFFASEDEKADLLGKRS